MLRLVIANAMHVHELGCRPVRITGGDRISRLCFENRRHARKGFPVYRAGARVFGILRLCTDDCLGHAAAKAGTAGEQYEQRSESKLSNARA